MSSVDPISWSQSVTWNRADTIAFLW